MKLLTITVPCYNSENYMKKCVDSLLEGGENVEILIVDDGSSDKTAQIADEYAEKFPTIVRAIHQENGGHGEAVNTGPVSYTHLYRAVFYIAFFLVAFLLTIRKSKVVDIVGKFLTPVMVIALSLIHI